MTNMQLAYTEYLENARHNRANENISAADVSEKARHNIRSEELNEADQYLRKYINDSSLLNARTVQQMKNDTDVLLQQMRNEISREQMQQKQQEIDNAYEKYQAEIKKLDADRTLSTERAKSEKQKRQADLKQHLLASVSNGIPAVSEAIINNKDGILRALKQPGYKNILDGIALAKGRTVIDDKTGAGHYRRVTRN